jgi:hypothetical protein
MNASAQELTYIAYSEQTTAFKGTYVNITIKLTIG